MKSIKKLFITTLSALTLCSFTMGLSSCAFIDSLLGTNDPEVQKLRIYYDGKEVGTYDDMYGCTYYDCGEFTYLQTVTVDESLFEFTAVLADGTVKDVTHDEKAEKYYDYTIPEDYVGYDTKFDSTKFVSDKPEAGTYTLRYRWGNERTNKEAIITYTVKPLDLNPFKLSMYNANDEKITTWEQGSSVRFSFDDSVGIDTKEFFPYLISAEYYSDYQALTTLEKKEQFLYEHGSSLIQPYEEYNLVSGAYYLGAIVNDDYYVDTTDYICSKNYSGISDFTLINIIEKQTPTE